MTCFCLIIDSTFASILSDKLTYELVVNRQTCTLEPEDLCNATLWIIAQNGDVSQFLAKLVINKAETINDGPQAGCCILFADIENSFYFLPRVGGRKDNWLVPGDIDQFRHNMIVSMGEDLSAAWDVSLANFNERRFSKQACIEADYEIDRSFPIDLLVTKVIKKLKSIYTMGDLFKYARHDENWTAYESQACLLLVNLGFTEVVVNGAIHRYAERRRQKVSASHVPEVDLDFRTISPDMIYARKFASRVEHIDWFNIGKKTEIAEHRHQQILRELTTYLISMGMVPLESHSIDLLLKHQDFTDIFEIKSATSDNFFVQGFKGAIQLLYYSYFAESQGLKLRYKCLVIESISNCASELHLKDFLKTVGIELLLYNEKMEWPNKIDIRLITENYNG